MVGDRPHVRDKHHSLEKVIYALQNPPEQGFSCNIFGMLQFLLGWKGQGKKKVSAFRICVLPSVTYVK